MSPDWIFLGIKIISTGINAGKKLYYGNYGKSSYPFTNSKSQVKPQASKKKIEPMLNDNKSYQYKNINLLERFRLVKDSNPKINLNYSKYVSVYDYFYVNENIKWSFEPNDFYKAHYKKKEDILDQFSCEYSKENSNLGTCINIVDEGYALLDEIYYSDVRNCHNYSLCTIKHTFNMTFCNEKMNHPFFVPPESFSSSKATFGNISTSALYMIEELFQGPGKRVIQFKPILKYISGFYVNIDNFGNSSKQHEFNRLYFNYLAPGIIDGIYTVEKPSHKFQSYQDNQIYYNL